MTSFSQSEKQQIKEMAAALDKQKAVFDADKLEVFEQLLKLQPFLEWSKDNIVINREVDYLNKQILITVIYKGEYEGNKTSLERLQEVEKLLEDKNDTKDVRISKALKVIRFDETQVAPEEEKEEEDASSSGD
jgi:hypothetical protein